MIGMGSVVYSVHPNAIIRVHTLRWERSPKIPTSKDELYSIQGSKIRTRTRTRLEPTRSSPK